MSRVVSPGTGRIRRGTGQGRNWPARLGRTLDRRFLAPHPRLATDAERAQARFLSALLLVLIAVALLSSVVLPPLMDPQFAFMADLGGVVGPAAALLFLVPYRLTRRGRLVPASVLTVVVTTVATWASALWALATAANHTPLYFLATQLVLSGFLLSLRWTTGIVVANVLGVFVVPLVFDVTFQAVMFPLILVVILGPLIVVTSGLRDRDIRALRARGEALVRSNEELERFAYVASHDLQEPLRTISTHAQLLVRRMQGRVERDEADILEDLTASAQRLQSLIRGLLEFSRLDARRQEPQPVDLDRVMRAVVRDLDAAIREHEARVNWASLPFVRGDPVQVTQVMLNLVGNAIKFRRGEPPVVNVRTAEKDGVVEVTVEDNGIGIEPEDHARLFTIFTRLHPVGRYPGTGIGLALSKKIVERHTGRMWVDSEPGMGTTFHFTLPRA